MTLFKISRFRRHGRFDYQIGNSSRGRNVTIDLTRKFQRHRIDCVFPNQIARRDFAFGVVLGEVCAHTLS